MAGPRALIEVRKPPIDAQFALHLPKVRGKCQWCGEQLDGDKTKWGGGRIYWHERCHIEFSVIIFPDAARRAVEDRDHGICCDCGQDWSDRYKFRKGATCSHWVDDDFENKRAGFYRSTEVLWISLWHVDHKTPLWKVAHLDALARLEYFKLANLVTRCHECHQRKTNQEAAERAKFDRLDPAVEQKERRKRSWGKRPMRIGARPRVRDINDD